MKQAETDSVVSVEDLLKALVGEDSDGLQQLDGRNIKQTIHFLEAARRRLDALAGSDSSQCNER